MQIEKDVLGQLVKTARKKRKLTQNELAEILDISSRHLADIENYEQKPSYDLLWRLIHELDIAPNNIFYPESKDNGDRELLIRLLTKCDDHEISVALAAVKQMLNKPANTAKSK